FGVEVSYVQTDERDERRTLAAGLFIEDPTTEQETAISYAAYRIISHRFQNSPGAIETLRIADSLFLALGHNPDNLSVDYANGSGAALGNYIANCYIGFGMQDGANEAQEYSNQRYVPINRPLDPTNPGNRLIFEPNNWQPLAFGLFIDQSGNPIAGEVPPFLSPEWGAVTPFALQLDDASLYYRDSFEYKVYHDPGPPAMKEWGSIASEYNWGFLIVALWSSHVDPADSVKIDISPGSQGNLELSDYPTTIEGLRDFYLDFEGGDISQGRDLNPATGQAYPPNVVYRGDYSRVLAEFWADGPDSETPPGHWFTILNYVNDHPSLQKRYKGEGPELDDLEWDIKAYFTLGGAMHDAAVTAWGIKGWYDYIRPISAIRMLADRGQCSNPNRPNYSPDGIPLVAGYIEEVMPGDSLAGQFQEHVGKIKIRAWRGPDYIDDPETDQAGVGWILVENWWPYQRPTFVTPNFAGYVSGHSTFSRAAAEVLTMLTGDPYFPGGVGEFVAKKNEFLVFEEGPSEDIVLQWATYRDASDQTSLSRIWGGIHPPVDDIPGRLIGREIGMDAFDYAERFISGSVEMQSFSDLPAAFPNPVRRGEFLSVLVAAELQAERVSLLNMEGKIVAEEIMEGPQTNAAFFQWSTANYSPGVYVVQIVGRDGVQAQKIMIHP
ncbi:MAG: T9SS type A sorting domain-containing protein, partial [Bacteroidota bacterium]